MMTWRGWHESLFPRALYEALDDIVICTCTIPECSQNGRVEGCGARQKIKEILRFCCILYATSKENSKSRLFHSLVRTLIIPLFSLLTVQTADMSFPEAVRETIAVNYHGVLRVCSAFTPLLQPHARSVGLVCKVTSYYSPIPGLSGLVWS